MPRKTIAEVPARSGRWSPARHSWSRAATSVELCSRASLGDVLQGGGAGLRVVGDVDVLIASAQVGLRDLDQPLREHAGDKSHHVDDD